MLDKKSLIVLTYLKNHFKSSDDIIHPIEININGLSFEDIYNAIETLDKHGYINMNTKYVGSGVESVNC